MVCSSSVAEDIANGDVINFEGSDKRRAQVVVARNMVRGSVTDLRQPNGGMLERSTLTVWLEMA